MLVGSLFMAGCESVGYYHQAAMGQWQLLSQRQPVAEILQQSDLDPQLRQRLRLSVAVLDHARDNLGIDAEGRYRQYVDLSRDYVVWNVFAAPELSLSPEQWCYPVVGCAPYRGYFAESAAHRKASQLAAQGLETYVGGVPAYSTLGWFDDPLLSTFINWPEADFVQLLMHELAHSRVWVSGDVAFNESFAEFVGLQGAKMFYTERGKPDAWQRYLHNRAAWRVFRQFLLDAKVYLEQVYANSATPQAKLTAYQQIRACYADHHAQLGGGRFDQVMDELNNAYLVSIGTYSDWIPGFRVLFAQADQDWPRFFTAVDELAELPQRAREEALTRLVSQDQVGHGTDHHDPKQIQCKAFSDHTLNLDAPS